VNELTTLRRAWEPPAAPSPEAERAARATLLAYAAREAESTRGGAVMPAHAERHRHGAPVALLRRAHRLRRVGGRRAALAGAALLLAVAGVVAAQNLAVTDGGGERGVLGVSSASAAVLHHVAAVAERQPFTAPRDDQWIYTRDEFIDANGATGTRTEWRRADGAAIAMLDERGVLKVEEVHEARPGLRVSPFESYKGAAALPADPDGLLRWAHRQTASVTGAGSTEDAEVFNILRGILGHGVLPPEIRAATFRAMAQIPGVRVRTVERQGIAVLGVSQTDGWLEQELLLDRDSYAYRGQRSTVVKDARIDPRKAGNATGEVKRGDTATTTRVATAVVDGPGERR
jgi:hypothetical protein